MAQRNKKRIICVVGPTASGKSALAVAIAKEFGGTIISADSRQVYRGLDIGTGKITKSEMRGVPHYLLNVASPQKTFTASQFVKKGRHVIEIMGGIPIICGGSGFYIDALVGRISIPDVRPNASLRKNFSQLSAEELFALLSKDDPSRAKTIDRHNKRRLVRSLEIAHVLGKNPPPSTDIPYEICWIGIQPDMAQLKQLITDRLAKRLRKGLIAEAKELHENGLSWKRMVDLGLEYRFLANYLQGDISRIEMIHGLTNAIYQYARRQKSYFKRNKDIRWYPLPIDTAQVFEHVRAFLYS